MPDDTAWRRLRTDAARLRSTSTVVSQPMQASVMLTPRFKPDGPSAGTFWFPGLRLLSIMTPTMASSPASSCAPMAAATLGWLL